ncbi:low temperature requirement protein A [Streptomyces sp. NPDC058045]|uniref:low temperature requirement protein A n=1 Tax=Streptomyces sp. NPDC058045 TaxID=3346311 RepID=UPI0036E6A39B
MTTSPDPDTTPPRPSSRPLRTMAARPVDEPHRVASPLELLFDLCFVVAIAQAGAQLVHSLVEHHTGNGVLAYAMIFFAIWWAWMNFTWFASAYDNDDVAYRLVTFVQITGVLVLAAGVSRAFQDHEYLAVWLGYAIMRLALSTQWLRASRGAHGPERRMAVRYAVGVLICQIGWLGLLLLPVADRSWVFLVMALAEMCVPVWAEHGSRSAWHPHHISERYGLFTIIVLGETVAAATVAVKSGIDEHDALTRLLPIAAGGLLIVFSAWWIYFVVPIHGHLRSSRRAFLWGYGHYLIFASAAAIGAGLEVSVEQTVGKTELSQLAASAAVTVPTAVFLFTVWALHARHYKVGIAQQLVLPAGTLTTLACTFGGHWAVLLAGLTGALTVTAGVILTAHAAPRAPRSPETGGSAGTDGSAETGSADDTA